MGYSLFTHPTPLASGRWTPSQWPRLYPALALTILMAVQGCATSPARSVVAVSQPELMQSDLSPASNPQPQVCDSQEDEVEPLEPDAFSSRHPMRQLAEQVTRYLNDHCYPLVRASSPGPDNGATEMILYGFVQTDFAKRDAEAIADALLANTALMIRDAILVRPNLPPVAIISNPQAAPVFENPELGAQAITVQPYQGKNGVAVIPAASWGGFETVGDLLESGGRVLVIPGPASYSAIGPGGLPVSSYSSDASDYSDGSSAYP